MWLCRPSFPGLPKKPKQVPSSSPRSNAPATQFPVVDIARSSSVVNGRASVADRQIDANAVTDAATYFDPTRPSVGVRHLFVSGVPVISDGRLHTDAFPGEPLRGEPR